MFPEITSALKGWFERRAEAQRPTELGLKGLDISFGPIMDPQYLKLLRLRGVLSSYGPSWSGESVTVQTALNHSVVWACNRLISESVAFLPLAMLQRKGNETRVATEHPMYSAMHDEPNAEMTAMTFRETRTSHCVLRGNGYAQILRRSGSGTAIELHPLMPEQVHPDREKQGQKRLVYEVKDGNSPAKTYTVERGKPQDILHLRGFGDDGLRGFSVISMARQSIGTALSAERHVGRFYANGGRVPYHLEMASKFKGREDFDHFREDWEKVYSEPHRAPILENDIKLVKDGLSMHDAQLLESRLFGIHEICRWFLVSPHLVGDLSRATFSNIEQLALEFVKMTLSTWITKWEQELRRCVLTDQEKAQGYFFKHNLNGLLRGDFQTRMAGYATGLQNGWMNQNEVRDLEDMNPFDGGDDYHIQLNMQSLQNGVPLTSQQSQLVRLGAS